MRRLNVIWKIRFVLSVKPRAANLARLPEEIAAAPDRAFVTYRLLMGPKSWFDYNYDASQLWECIEVNMTMFDYVWGEVFRDIDITEDLDKLKAPVFLALDRNDYFGASRLPLGRREGEVQ